MTYAFVSAIGAPQGGPGLERWYRLEKSIAVNDPSIADHAKPANERRGFYRLNVETGAWQNLSDIVGSDVMIRCLAVHPTNPSIIYAGGENAIYTSHDSGDNWIRVPFEGENGVVWTIVFHPADPDVMYIGTEQSTLYRSDDAGRTFRELRVPKPAATPDTPFPMHMLRVSFDPQNPNTVFAALEVGGVVRSLDGGESWEDCGQTLLDIVDNAPADRFPGSVDKVEDMLDSHSVLASPVESGTAFLGNRLGLFKSTDRGTSWADMRIDRLSNLNYVRDLHTPKHRPDMLFGTFSNGYIDNAGSLWRSDDGGANWQQLGKDLTIDSTLMAVATSQTSPERVFCVTYGGRLFGSEDFGKSWKSYQLPDGTVGVFGLAVN